MTQDAELERLKDAQDRSFQTKQDAYEKQDRAWDRRSSARDAMNRAFEAKQSAYETQNASWEAYQSVRSSNGPRIDQLNAEQESAFENMKRAFDDASRAYDDRDGEVASSYAADGHQYKAESQQAVVGRRELVAEIRQARDEHEKTKPGFQEAKIDFERAREDFNQAKDKHERKKTDFQNAKAKFEEAKQAFQSRLETLKAATQARRNDNWSLAVQAGVPSEYLDNVYVTTDSDGTVNIYFGGIGEPNGEGHGHYAMDSSGNVTYRRDPFDPHGAHNFTDRKYPYLEGRGWYSKTSSSDNVVHILHDKDGDLTTSYPHVHEIHDPEENAIFVIASYSPQSHSEPIILPLDASGNEVRAAVIAMQKRL